MGERGWGGVVVEMVCETEGERASVCVWCVCVLEQKKEEGVCVCKGWEGERVCA